MEQTAPAYQSSIPPGITYLARHMRPFDVSSYGSVSNLSKIFCPELDGCSLKKQLGLAFVWAKRRFSSRRILFCVCLLISLSTSARQDKHEQSQNDSAEAAAGWTSGKEPTQAKIFLLFQILPLVKEKPVPLAKTIHNLYLEAKLFSFGFLTPVLSSLSFE